MTSHLEIKNLLCDEQYGFRPKRSTSTAIFNFLKNIIDEINNRKIVGTIYLDFSKAFDSINHTRLLDKLKDMGIPIKVLSSLKAYFKHRQIKTKLNKLIKLSFVYMVQGQMFQNLTIEYFVLMTNK